MQEAAIQCRQGSHAILHPHDNSESLPQDRQVPSTGRLEEVHSVTDKPTLSKQTVCGCRVSRPGRCVAWTCFALAKLSSRRLTRRNSLGGHQMCSRHDSTVSAPSSRAEGSKNWCHCLQYSLVQPCRGTCMHACCQRLAAQPCAAAARGATHSATAHKLQAGQFLTQLHVMAACESSPHSSTVSSAET